jgi:hypothetical protein
MNRAMRIATIATLLFSLTLIAAAQSQAPVIDHAEKPAAN